MSDRITNAKCAALAKFLDIHHSDIGQSHYDENTFTAQGGNAEWLVLTDDEADERAKEYILDSLWAFNASFIAAHSGISLNGRAFDAFQKMQGELCEDANDLVRSMITDLDDFVRDAISADGRGHFLSHYDGEEHEVDVAFLGSKPLTFYVYRTN